MGWGTSWDKPKQTDESTFVYSGDSPILKYAGTVELPKLEEVEKHQFKNKVPTHDPYTNPNAFLYYECDCGQVLDPHVKSFASLNNHASDAGWKIRWGEKHYVPHCPKCAVEKGIE